jgi:nickel-dependent lactate racemase
MRRLIFIVIKIPFDEEFLDLVVSREKLQAVLEPKINIRRECLSEKDIVIESLQKPIGSPRLKDLAVNKNKVVIITSDHTRPVPSKITLPLIIEEIRKANEQADITVLVGTGLHRKPTAKELVEKFGVSIVEREKIVVHEAKDRNSLTYCGDLPSGCPLWLNTLALEADLLVAEGFIEPHFFAGFSGGRKSILPGISGEDTIKFNHSALLIDHEASRAGCLEHNLINQDMLMAARKSKLVFILNVVLHEKRIIASYAGDAQLAHTEGCNFVKKHFAVKAEPADIVITSNGGYPLDQNLYQAVKGITTGEKTCKDGGVIIIAAGCRDGIGGKKFFDILASENSPAKVLNNILAKSPRQTELDQWQAQILARVLVKHKVIVVTKGIEKEMLEKMHLQWAPTLNYAVLLAEKLMGENSKITVVPDGIETIIE